MFKYNFNKKWKANDFEKLLVLIMVGVVCLAGAVPLTAGQDMVGMDAPGFRALDMSQMPRDLKEELDGGIVLLDFWSIYCVDCVKELPSVIELHQKYGNEGLKVFAVNMDSFGSRRVKRFIDGLDYEIPFPVIIDMKREIAISYKVNVLPTTVLIDSTGKIDIYHIGFRDGDQEKLEARIKELIPANRSSRLGPGGHFGALR